MLKYERVNFVDVGDKFHMEATVKEHSEYQGQAQTVVQRITILE